MRLPQELAKLDRFDLLILDDLSYVRRDQAETSVLFELIQAPVPAHVIDKGIPTAVLLAHVLVISGLRSGNREPNGQA